VTASSSQGEGFIGVTKCTDDGCFEWCGNIIDTINLEIKPSFVSYCGCYIGETQTSRIYEKNPGESLAKDLKRFIRNRLHSLYLDTTINSIRTVQLTIYQLFLLSAMKFHTYVRHLPQKNINFFTNVILDFIDYVKNIVNNTRNNKELCALGFKCALRTIHIDWLGLEAFLTILRKKNTIYTQLLKNLKLLQNQEKVRTSVTKAIREVVDSKNSKLFDHILF